MTTEQTRQEIEEYLGQVPSWMDILPEGASDHSWGIFRDFSLGETDLSEREKALVGVGVASAIKCPYCTYFHKEEARLSDVTEDELEEAITFASVTQYFSTVLHGNEVDVEEFVAETDEIMEYVEDQQAQAADD